MAHEAFTKFPRRGCWESEFTRFAILYNKIKETSSLEQLAEKRMSMKRSMRFLALLFAEGEKKSLQEYFWGLAQLVYVINCSIHRCRRSSTIEGWRNVDRMGFNTRSVSRNLDSARVTLSFSFSNCTTFFMISTNFNLSHPNNFTVAQVEVTILVPET